MAPKLSLGGKKFETSKTEVSTSPPLVTEKRAHNLIVQSLLVIDENSFNTKNYVKWDNQMGFWSKYTHISDGPM